MQVIGQALNATYVENGPMKYLQASDPNNCMHEIFASVKYCDMNVYI